jgi:hypothetical protein
MTPFEHVFWTNPSLQYAVHTHTNPQLQGWQFPPDAFSSPFLVLPDWYGPWPEINQAYWRSECGMGYTGDAIDSDPVNVGVQLVALNYGTPHDNPQVLMSLENLCQPGKLYSSEYNRNITTVLKPVFAAAVPSRNGATQLAVRIKADDGREGRVYSSRLVIVWKT